MPPSLVTVHARIVSTTPFFCPTCGGDRLAEVRDGRRILVIARVPVTRWSRTEPHVTCSACGTVHPTDSLDVLTTAELTTRLIDLTRVLTVMVVRAGDPAHRDLRRRAVQHVRTVIPDYNQNRLDRDLVQLDPATVRRHVTPVADALEVEGQERLVAAMVQVALAAHTITPHQRWLLDSAGTGLGLTPMHITGIISAVAAAVEPVGDDSTERP